MNKEVIAIPGGSITLNGFASARPMEDPYVTGILHKKETAWKRAMLEDLEERSILLLQKIGQPEKIGAA